MARWRGMMASKKEIVRKQKAWDAGIRKKAVDRFPALQSPPSEFYTPADVKGFDFLDKVGFPGEYPFTAGTYPFDPIAGLSKLAAKAPRASGLTRAAGYSEMLSHRWLTDDHSVQRTEFANGVTVTVNFGDAPFRLKDGTLLEPLSHRVEGL